MERQTTSRPRVAVGMSGGTDSSLAAALLAGEVFEVIGLTAHMWKEGSRCCSLEDVERARRVCRFLGIRHYVVNAQRLFEERVVDPFVREYVAGRTPSPCVACNEFVKFGFLLDRAVQLGCERLATGHYARTERAPDGRMRLLRALDAGKDQSYFLHRLNQRQLARLTFPLAGISKTEAKARSAARGLPVVPRGESQDLCFVEAGRLPEFVEARDPSVVRSGVVVAEGRVVGRHEGVHRFTVGQRGKLGVALGERMYVTRIDAGGGVVEIGPREAAMRRRCSLRAVHWIAGEAPAGEIRCGVRPRYRAAAAPASVTLKDGDRAEVVFDEPQFAPAPGQAAVFYAGDEVLGGGWIE